MNEFINHTNHPSARWEAEQLRARLKEAVAREEYEKAAEYRDRIRSLESRMEEQPYGS